MAAKRDSSLIATDLDHDEPAADYQPNTKRARNNNNQRSNHNRKQQQQKEPATNVTYGQRCCFPGIDDQGDGAGYEDEDLEFEDESNALAYLKSVRQEASGIPHLLVAPKSGPQLPRGTFKIKNERDHDDDDDVGEDEPIDRSIYTDGHGDTRGYYQDGAYTAAPDEPLQITTTNDSKNDDDEALKIAEAYFSSLCTSFLSLRNRLHTPPPAHLLSSLPRDHSSYVGPFGPSSRTFTLWTSRLHTTDPHPVQLASMDKSSAFRLLRVLLGGGKFLRSGVEVSERTSRWLWALLARLPDRGELDHVEVGHVRELGKRAAVLMHSLQQMALLREEVELGGHDDDAGEGVWGWDQEDSEDAGGEGPARQETDQPIAKTTTLSSDDHDDLDNKSTHGKDNNEADMEDGEIEDESIPMDTDNEDATTATAEDMEAAKARLLAALEAAPSDIESNDDDEQPKPSGTEAEDKNQSFDPIRARMNMRATLNMILTVAGEFYGQRDLLEFRDPFRGI